MSLINDALKRAQQIQAEPLHRGPMLRPVEAEQPPARKAAWLVPAGLGVVLLASGLVVWKLASLRSEGLAAARMTEVRAVGPAIEPVAPPIQAAPATPAAPAADALPPAAQEPLAVAHEAATRQSELETPARVPAQAVPLVAPAQQPTQSPAGANPPKLQSIIYSQSPSAMISGLIVREGDPVGNLRVKKIRPNQVELAGENQTIVLTLR